MTSSSPSSSSRPNKRAASIRDFLPPPSAKQYIRQPSRRMSLRPIPSPASSSSSASSGSSCCFSAISSSSNGTPPSDHAGESSMQDKTDVDRATREYHAAVAHWTAKTWQAVRFVIEQRSRHPAYNTSPPRARSKSPHYSIPVQNTTSLHSLTTSSASNSSSCMGTPHNADGLSAASAMMTPSSRQNSFRKQPLHHNTSSSSSSAATNHPSISGLSALFASHAAIGDAASSSGANVQATH